MLHAALAFLPFAAMLAVSPGPATAMVIQSAARGGRAYAVRATLGDAAGLALWAVASMLGVSALVVASHAAYTALKVVGAIVLIAYGVAAIRRARRHEPAPGRPARAAIQISLSCAWYFVIASAVGRAREAFVRRRAQIQALTGSLMIGFGLKVLADQRH